MVMPTGAKMLASRATGRAAPQARPRARMGAIWQRPAAAQCGAAGATGASAAARRERSGAGGRAAMVGAGAVKDAATAARSTERPHERERAGHRWPSLTRRTSHVRQLAAPWRRRPVRAREGRHVRRALGLAPRHVRDDLHRAARRLRPARARARRDRRSPVCPSSPPAGPPSQLVTPRVAHRLAKVTGRSRYRGGPAIGPHVPAARARDGVDAHGGCRRAGSPVRDRHDSEAPAPHDRVHRGPGRRVARRPGPTSTCGSRTGGSGSRRSATSRASSPCRSRSRRPRTAASGCAARSSATRARRAHGRRARCCARSSRRTRPGRRACGR